MLVKISNIRVLKRGIIILWPLFQSHVDEAEKYFPIRLMEMAVAIETCALMAMILRELSCAGFMSASSVNMGYAVA
jgi:hypothetical protein